MATKVPLTGSISWPSFVFQLALTAAFYYLYWQAGSDQAFLFAAFTYAAIVLVLRKLIASDHRQGMRLIKQRQFKEAIPMFEKSVAFFSKNQWIDKYRFICLLSSSGTTYKEMGLCNIAFCFSQTGNGAAAKMYYEQVLKEFPGNGLAATSLNMLEAGGQQTGLVESK